MDELVTPFLTDDPMFACGVEFGMVYSQLSRRPTRLKTYLHLENQDRVLVLAHRLGYKVAQMKTWDTTWFYLILRRL